jgi:hypothetical protein
MSGGGGSSHGSSGTTSSAGGIASGKFRAFTTPAELKLNNKTGTTTGGGGPTTGGSSTGPGAQSFGFGRPLKKPVIKRTAPKAKP